MGVYGKAEAAVNQELAQVTVGSVLRSIQARAKQ